MKARSIQIEHRSRNKSYFVHKKSSLNTKTQIHFLNVYHANINDQEAGDTDLMSAKIE